MGSELGKLKCEISKILIRNSGKKIIQILIKLSTFFATKIAILSNKQFLLFSISDHNSNIVRTNYNFLFPSFAHLSKLKIRLDGTLLAQQKKIATNGNYQPHNIWFVWRAAGCCSCKWDFLLLNYLQKLMVCGWWIIQFKP